MIREWVEDKYGNEIYITEERWNHVLNQHSEMTECWNTVLKTLRTGTRRQDRENPSKFWYSKKFKNLPYGNAIVVITKFSFKNQQGKRIPNNFVITAFQRYIK